jgi:hypothetical protein
MTITTTTLTFNSHPLEALQMGGQMWLRGDQLDHPLGYQNERNIHLLYTRNADEFTADEMRIVTLPTAGGMQETRVFSLRGARLLALLARTPEAKAFRRWVLDLIEGRVVRRPSQGRLALPGTYPLPLETVRLLDEMASLLEAGHPARDAVEQFRTGARSLSADPSLDHLADRFDGLRQTQGEVNRGYRDLARDARRIGYSWEAVKLHARGRPHHA